jgi:hypothetical protein
MGWDHAVVFREDGTASASSSWSKVPRRKPVRFARSESGGLKPIDGGKRRAAVIDEFGWLLNAHGVALSDRDRPGPKRLLPETEVVSEVNYLHSQGRTFDTAYADVAKSRHSNVSSVKRAYLSNRHRQTEESTQAESSPCDEGPWGPDLLQWLKTIEVKANISFTEACKSVASIKGWTPEQLNNHLSGTWRWSQSVKNPAERLCGDRIRVNEPAKKPDERH